MKISVIDGYTENPGDLSWDGLRALGDVVIYDHSTKDEAEIIRRVGDAEIVVANKSPLSRRVLDACPNVKYITVQATGYDPINYVYAREKGIPVSNVPTYGTASVAQFAIALLLEICGHAAHHSDAVHAGRWAECGEWTFWDYPMIALAGKTMGVIGFGRIGKLLAHRLRGLGAEVTVVEKQHLGGTCLNVGGIPTKCLLHSAELLEDIKNQGKEIGVEVEGVKVNFPQVIAHKNAISKQLPSGVAGLLKLNKVKKIDGEAAFVGEKRIRVTKPDGSAEEMTADAIIVATGSVNAVPPIPGIRENPNCIDSTGALSLEKLPESMVVIGGGVIGLELACAYAAFGTRITVVEAMDHMLPMLDGDLTAVGVAHMKKMGIAFALECPVQAVEPSPVGAKVVCTTKSGDTVTFEAEKVLVAIGRKANTASLDLEAGGIRNDRGRILVNDRMQTNVPGVYAIGDCVFGKAQLAHTASAMGEVAAENIMGHASTYDESTNPTCVYMEPEAASVGLTEEQCKAKGLDYKVGKFPMSANGKALIINGGEGLVKIISDAKYGEVLGMHIIGPRATDLISEGALAIRLEATVDELISTILSHPTVTETIREAAQNAKGLAIHTKHRTEAA